MTELWLSLLPGIGLLDRAFRDEGFCVCAGPDMMQTGETMAHPDKHIRETIEYALEKGWRFEKSGPRAHAFGRLYCGFGCCLKSVYGTPRNPQSWARRLRREIDKCESLIRQQKESREDEK